MHRDRGKRRPMGSSPRTIANDPNKQLPYFRSFQTDRQHNKTRAVRSEVCECSSNR
ncbi:hypothetical protein K0M31_016226 [Melipona bicolor]|uniref:Uncharacterized protein n=1 Tax=Melipona bicolor TaxID=60889 RepID=A0AA40KT90_9HYME|nr:hypothetical protein K0M31_016226 [Melipona bicolor]